MPIEDAVELYLDTREDGLREVTVRSHRYRLQHFVRFAKEYEIESTCELNG
ncbi:XerD/XerC family integrase [Halomicrobium sp. LC1Hm]|nr:XerD/XerC family integrase [Halomicrobium sp. LC1Hm]